MSGRLRNLWSPPAALRAVRAAVVMPGLFAFCEEVIGNVQMATFSAFGSFATLVLVSFGGGRRAKLIAHLGLAAAGSALLTIGTAVSSSTALAAAVTLPVTFLVFFAGVTGPSAASATTGALLAYVLPAASPGTVSMIPDRLAGWWLASVVGTVAVLASSPRPGTDRLRACAARLAGALAGAIEQALRGAAPERQLAGAMEAKRALRRQFALTPYRPTGLAAPDEALANAIELLEWCTVLIADMAGERGDLRHALAAERSSLATGGAVLRGVESLFGGGAGGPEPGDLERLREGGVAGVEQLSPAEGASGEAARIAFHAHMIAITTLAIAADALVACERADPEWLEAQRGVWYGGSRTARLTARHVAVAATAARRHASVRSVWLINSVRGSVALAVAVTVADVSSVQHGFWVVLGTLSVLRTSLGATGATALRAIAGTAIGFVIGGALLLAIGSSSGVLWAVLPIAVLLAAYTPGVASFAVGQAAFTVTLAVLFNLLAPVGWKVGVVRVEDVALGCGVSVVVGMLFWPHGLAAVLGDDLADAFRSGAAYLTQAIEFAADARAPEPAAAEETLTAAARLDEALRAFLAEQGSKHLELQELWRLVGGSVRLRLTAYSIAALPRAPARLGSARAALTDRAGTLADWLERLADTVGKPDGRAPRALSPPAFDPAAGVDESSGSRLAVWLCEHLDHLAEHLADLVQPALRVAELRRRSWWR
jgi:uncharacterized membrane protein YccC